MAQRAGPADRTDGKRPGSDHYEPISWDGALDLWQQSCVGSIRPTRRCSTPRAGSATRRRSCCSFRRAYGTNNLPDCSNMCHESSGAGLNETLGVGKGSVSLDDMHKADLVLAWASTPAPTSSDAFGAGGDEAQRWVRHRCQPVAGSGAHSVQEPSERKRSSRPGNRDRRPVPAHQAVRRPGVVSGDRAGFCWKPRTPPPAACWTSNSSTPLDGFRRVRRPHATVDGRMSLRRPDLPDGDRARP